MMSVSATEKQPSGTNANAPQDLVSVAESLASLSKPTSIGITNSNSPPTPGGVGFPLSSSTVSSDDEEDCNNNNINVEQQSQHFQQQPINSPPATTLTLPAESTSTTNTPSNNTIAIGAWTTSEHTLFLAGIRKHGFNNWSKISTEHVKTRTPRQCQLHSIKVDEQQVRRQSQLHSIKEMKKRLPNYSPPMANNNPPLDATTLEFLRKHHHMDRAAAIATQAHKYTPAESTAAAAVASSNTIANGRWTTEEHNIFIEAVNKYGRRWKLISLHVKSRSPDQCRSHGQKYFKRFEKNMLEIPFLGKNNKRLMMDASDDDADGAEEESSEDGNGGDGNDKPRRKKRKANKDAIRSALEKLGMDKFPKKKHTNTTTANAKDDKVQEGETTTTTTTTTNSNNEKGGEGVNMNTMPLWIWSVIFTPVGNWRSGKDVDDRVMMHCKAIKLLMSMKFMSITPSNPSSSPPNSSNNNSIGNTNNSTQWHEQRNRRFASILRCFEELHYQSSPSLSAYKDVDCMKARLRLFIVHVLGMAPKILSAPGEGWQDEGGDLKMREGMMGQIVNTIASKKPNAPRIWTDFVQRDTALKCFEELHYWMAPSLQAYQHEGFMKQMLALFAKKYLKRWRGCVFQ